MKNIRAVLVLKKAVMFAFAVVLCGMAPVMGQSAYSFQRTITIDHTKVPNSDQSSFPVLISGTYKFLATVANGGRVQNASGYDVIFTSDSAGTVKLDHEIESYDPVTGAATFWVRIPSLSHTADTVIYVQYGNSGITTSQENKAGVWQGGYQSVYHMTNAASLGSDSGSAGYNLAQAGSIASVNGKIGGGISLNGNTGNYLYHDSVASYPSGTSAVTVETWVQASGNPNGEIVGYGDNSHTGARAALGGFGSVFFEFENLGIAINYPPDSQWHHLVGVYGGGTTGQVYLDGVLAGSSTSIGPPSISTTEFKIGGIPTVTFCCAFAGSVDEVRVVSGALSSDWIATEYNNQNSPGTFYSIGLENGPFINTLSPSTGSAGTSVTISGVGFGATAGTITFNGQAAAVTTWSDTSIVAVVPSGATSGPVVVSQAGMTSNGPVFAIFNYRRAIVIDHTKVPNTDQSSFPVSISGTFNYLATTANGGKVQSIKGYDVIFTSDSAGAVKLDHEIESYDPVTGTVNFWVRVPTLSHTADTVIYMQYGSGSVSTSFENKTGVWDSSYRGVWHFASQSALSALDSTANANNGTINGSPGVISGKFGGAANFAGASDDIAVQTVPLNNVNYTISAWFTTPLPRAIGGFNTLTRGVNNDHQILVNESNWHLGSYGNQSAGFVDSGFNVSTLSSGWHYVVASATGSSTTFYVDGIPAGTIPFKSNAELSFLGNYQGGSQQFGAVDEVRVSTGIARSADWITAEYNNQSSQGTFYRVGPENDPFVTALLPSTGLPGTSVTISGVGFGATAGTVTFNGQVAAITSWSDTSIVAVAPSGATTGPVVVSQAGMSSNGPVFAIFNYRRAIVINHTKVPNTDQSSFPVLVSGAYSFLATAANGGKVQNANGYDIIFSADTAGTVKLDHEIESYDPVTGTINFWVRMPSLSHTADTVIYMQYGSNGVTTTLENQAGVWSNGYAGVWHFSNNGALSVADSTGNNSATASSVTGSTGKIAGAGSFSNSTGSYVRVANSASIKPSSALTLEAWVKPNSTGSQNWGNVVSLGYRTDSSWNPPFQSYGLFLNNASFNPDFGITTVGSSSTVIPNGVVTQNAWTHVAGVYDGSIEKVYINGLADPVTVSVSGLLDYRFSGDLAIGLRSPTSQGNPWDGLLDEVRISSVPRSADWIATEYNNQNAPATFLGVGPENAPFAIALSPSTGSPGTSVTISGTGFGATAGTVTFNGQAAAITSWSDTSIVAVAPGSAISGQVVVTTQAGVPSNGLTFAIFNHRRALSINHTKVSNTDQNNFPVLVSGTYSYLATVANGGSVVSQNGYDIVFTSDAAGTVKLDHEIDSYDPVTGTINFWVRVPVLSHTADTVIYMQFGSSNVNASLENRTGVWSNGYAGVWHFSNNGALSVADSTGNNSATVSSVTGSTGKIAGAGSFSNSTGSYVRVANSASIKPSSGLTLEAWVNPNSTGSQGWPSIISLGYRSDSSWNPPFTSYDLFLNAATFNPAVDVTTLASSGAAIANGAVTQHGWTHVVGVYDGSLEKVYINGLADPATVPMSGLLDYRFSGDLAIGLRNPTSPGNPWDGLLDEVRISSVPRSSDWIATEYNNQSSPGAFYALGADFAPFISSLSPSTGTPGTSVTLSGSSFGATAGTVTFNGQTAVITSWSDTSIVAVAPSSATTGPVVAVSQAGMVSNGPTFAIFNHSRPVVLDHTKIANTDQNNFPVLVSGTYSYLAAVANGGSVVSPNGYDIVFTSDAAGTVKLDHEIESYNPVTGTINFWVRVPVLSHTANTVIYMQYGSSNVNRSLENRPGVWSNGYAGVWHLATSGGAVSVTDSTGNTSATNTNVSAQTGHSDGAGGFTGNSYVRVANSNAFKPASALTVEAWVNPSSITAWNKMLSLDYRADGSWNSPFVSYSVGMNNNTQGISFQIANGGVGAVVASSSTIPLNSWSHVVGTFDSSTHLENLYLNGVQNGSVTNNGSAIDYGTSQDLTIGQRSPYSPGEGWNGVLDEVRISSVSRSPDWIATEYNNQSSPAAFLTINLENAPVITALSSSTGGAGASVVISGIKFGATAGTVTFNGQTASITNWSDSSIVAIVPNGSTSGPVVVTQGGVPSNGPIFDVFSYRRAVIVDHTKVPTDQSNFPVVVSGTYNFLATVANGGKAQSANGYDIIFTSDPTGTVKLDHEIESYDPVTGAATFWVRIPSLSHTADTVIYMQYGSNGITTTFENQAGVWSNGYDAVWHLSKNGAVSTGDSTGNNSATLVSVGAATGKISGAGDFGGNSFVQIAPSTSFEPSSAITLEAWVNPRSAGRFGSGNVISLPAYGMFLNNFSLKMDFAVTTGGTSHVITSAASMPQSSWTHVAEVYDGGAEKIYFNGRADLATAPVSGPIDYSGSSGMWLGTNALINGNTWDGLIDEIRISSVPRSSDWITTEYNNQNSPATFYGIGPENAPFIASLSPITGSPGTSVTISGVGFGTAAGTVAFNGQTAAITSWSDTSIVAVAPSGTTSGPVVVSQSGVSSNGPVFAVFGYFRPVVIDHTQVPNTDQSSFPVLISGTYNFLATVANGGKVQNAKGYDIILTSDNAGAVKLDHEIESYDPATGTINFWVRVPTLSHTVDTVIYLQYGSSVITTSLENSTGVWSNGYEAVWHFPNPNSFVTDATGNTSAFSVGVFSNTGKIGGAGYFPGINSFMRVGPSANLGPPSALTLETWVNPGRQGNIISSLGYGMFFSDSSLNMNFAVTTGGTNHTITSSGPLTQNAWAQVAAVYDGAAEKLYVNGLQDPSTAPVSGPIGYSGSAGLSIGENFSGASEINAVLDEVRISGVARSADWIATEYNNQNSPATFYGLGGEDSNIIILAVSPGIAAPRTPVTITGQGFGPSAGTLTFNGLPATVASWSDSSIVTTVPDGASTGPLVVTAAGLVSNGPLFTVLSPVVAAVTPPSAEPQTSVTITGTSFGPAPGTVTINGQTVSIINWSDTSISVVVPASATSGNLVVSNRGLQSPGVNFTVQLPAITSLNPGAADLGALITINGTYFGVSRGSVTFNGLAATVASWSDSRIQARVPYGATSGSVVVTSTAGRASNAVGFGVTDDLAVTFFSPASGPVGTTVTITGGGFGASQGSNTVQFNGVTAQIVTWSDTQITAIVPAGALTGIVDVLIGGNNANSSSEFAVTTTVQLTDSLGRNSSYQSVAMGGNWQSQTSTGSGCSSCSVRGNVQSSWDSTGNLLTQTDELGRVNTYTYDADNNVASQSVQLDANTAVTTSYTYNSFGEPRTVTDPLGNTTTNTYDAHGNLLTITTPAPDASTAASVTQFAYDNKGELTQITDPLNHSTTLTYNAAGLIATITDAQQNATTYQYDSHGNRTAVVDTLQHQTSFTYDAVDRLVTITYPDLTTVSFGYDSRDRRTSVTDQNGRVTTYSYDDADRLTSVTDANYGVTQYAYDTESNLLSITDANGHATSFSYDAFGRVTQTTFPSTLVETYNYDATGNLISTTDRKNQTILYVYDALDRLTHKGYPDSTGVDYIYDLVGKIKQVSDPTGTYGFAYDNMGRLIGATTKYSFLPGTTFTNSYSYDAASNRTSFTASDSSTNLYQYDALNRLTSLNNSLTGQFGFGYDVLGRRTVLTRPNGVNTNYTYDSLSRLLSVLHQSATNTLDGASYTYDHAGNRLSKNNFLNGVTEQYTYDPLYQLKQVTQGTATTESYSYDAVGNRLSSLSEPALDYNASNQLTATSTDTFVYDADGNTLSKTDSTGTRSYTWDFESRLSSVVLPGSGGTVTFKYDPFGRRIQKSFMQNSTSTTTNYLYDGNNSIEELDSSGNELAGYSQGVDIDEPLAARRSGSTSYYQQDALGSVTSVSGNTGTLANLYAYDAFGNLTMSTGSIINPFQYTGRDYDPETGLRYYRARYYDSRIARFISEDPLSLHGGLNLYAYVDNDPTSFDDPFGLKKKPGRKKPCCDAHLPVDPDARILTKLIFAEATEDSGISDTDSWNEMLAIAFEPINRADYTAKHPKDHGAFGKGTSPNVPGNIVSQQFGSVNSSKFKDPLSVVNSLKLSPKGNSALCAFFKRAIDAANFALANPAADPFNNVGGVFGNRTKGHGPPGGDFTQFPAIPGSNNNFYGVSR
jgi:RHS repeat-associated protein